jgi:diguanylate cyclase (GGDEF)-like protein/PAS domain S-box-containing protein
MDPIFARIDNEFVRPVIDALPGVFVILDADGRFVLWNAAFERLTGYDAEELAGMTPRDITPELERPLLNRRLDEAFSKGASGAAVSVQSKDGTLTPYEFNGHRVTFDGRAYVVAMGFDVTERKREEADLQRERSMFRAMTEHSRDITTVVANDGTIVYESPAIERILGYRPEEVVGRPFGEFLHPDDLAVALRDLHQALADGLARETPAEFRFRRKDGTYCLLSATGGTIAGLGLVANSRDVTDQRATEEQVRRLALYDGLTSLANRNLLLELVEEAVEHAQRQNGCGLILFFDLDRFKAVNDSLGHHRGDRLLQLVAERLRGALSHKDTLARHGGDEFIAIVPGVSLDESGALARRLLDALKDPFFVDPHELHVTCSVGICGYPEDGVDASTLIRNADAAMYAAKAAGRNTFRRFTSEMSERANEGLKLANDLHRALAGGELEPYYQPMVDIASGKLLGYEALVRWHHPERGLVMPNGFIAAAEDVGLIERIGALVFDRACEQLRAWRDAGQTDLIVAINVSGRQLFTDSIVDVAKDCLRRHGVPAECVELEITENVFISDEQRVVETLEALYELGLRIVIDDFGVGYSSLGYLRRLNVSKVKIDRSFVNDMHVDEGASAIIAAVVTLGRAFGFAVLAEGVETAGELEAVRKTGCDQAQGFLFGRPVPASKLGARAG